MADTIVIRPAEPSDLARIDALLSASFPRLLKAHYPLSLLVTAIPLISRAQPHLIATGTYFLAEDVEGSVVGAGGWTPASPQGGRRIADVAHVRHFVTDHRRTRQGIGRKLMAHVIKDVRSNGMRRIECISTLAAVSFYAACGFQLVGDILVPLRAGIELPAKAMVLHLD